MKLVGESKEEQKSGLSLSRKRSLSEFVEMNALDFKEELKNESQGSKKSGKESFIKFEHL